MRRGRPRVARGCHVAGIRREDLRLARANMPQRPPAARDFAPAGEASAARARGRGRAAQRVHLPPQVPGPPVAQAPITSAPVGFGAAAQHQVVAMDHFVAAAKAYQRLDSLAAPTHDAQRIGA
jgi:hypothetical protein